MHRNFPQEIANKILDVFAKRKYLKYVLAPITAKEIEKTNLYPCIIGIRVGNTFSLWEMEKSNLCFSEDYLMFCLQELEKNNTTSLNLSLLYSTNKNAEWKAEHYGKYITSVSNIQKLLDYAANATYDANKQKVLNNSNFHISLVNRNIAVEYIWDSKVVYNVYLQRCQKYELSSEMADTATQEYLREVKRILTPKIVEVYFSFQKEI